ncbi:hypothetical protein Tco_0742918 [Tanacetum coccineum]
MNLASTIDTTVTNTTSAATDFGKTIHVMSSSHLPEYSSKKAVDSPEKMNKAKMLIDELTVMIGKLLKIKTMTDVDVFIDSC